MKLAEVVAAAKLPILNPNEFDMWKMRIEQYFLITDYSLWEVILNGDSSTPTRIVDVVVQVIAPTNAEQRVSAGSYHASVSTLPNVDSLSAVVIYSFFASYTNSPQLENEDLKQIDADYLEEMDLKWQMDMLTMRARMFLQKTRRNLGANGTVAIGFDMSKVECYNCHRIGHFARDCRSPRDNKNKDTPRRTVPVEVSTSNALVSQCDAVGSYNWSFQADEEPINYALMEYASSSSSSSSRIENELKLELRKKFEKAEKERDALKLTLEKFQTSKNLNASVPTSPVHDRYKPGKGYHAVPPPYTRTFMPPKPNLVFNDAPKASETVTNVKEPSFVQTSKPVKTPRASVKTIEHPKKVENLMPDNQKSRVLTRSGLVSLNTARPVSTAVPHTTMKRSPMPVTHVVYKAHSPIRRPINQKPATKTSNFNQKVTAVQVNKVTAIKGNKGSWVWKPKCTMLDHVSRLTSASMNLKKFDYTDALGRSNKELASPKQTALGKDNSNPLIVDSLLKTIWHFITDVSYKLMLFGLTKDVAVKLMLLGRKFADTHNMIAFFSKSNASAGFDQIVDFLNAQVIQYALMEDVVITEDVIRQDLCLDDADGVECLPNEEIFAELALPKELAWNELIFSMASAVICLATCRKFNFSKYIFDSMVRNVDRPSKFLMVGRGFSRVETPLFATMLVQPQPPVVEEEDEVQTCVTLSQKFAHLEQDKISQALKIIKLKKRVKKLEKTRRSKFSGGCIQTGGIEAIDADKEITLVEIETKANLGAELQGRKDDDNATIKDASAAEPNMFDDKKVNITMAQTLIKMKAEKARLLYEQMDKRLHDEEVEKAATKEKQKNDDLEKAKVLQKQYVNKQENIDWNVVVEQMQEKHLDNIIKYQSLKRNPISIAQARKNMIAYLKNIVGYKMEHFKCMTFDKESFKKLKAVEVSGSHSTQDTPTDDPKEMSKEDVKNMLEVILVSEFKVKALQVNSAEPTIDKEKALWVELKRLFEPDPDDVIWKLQRYMHYPIMWKLHSNCGVHRVSSTTIRHDMYMLTEKDYPLSNGVITLMLSTRLQVEEDIKMARNLVMKIFMKANQPKSRSLDTSSKIDVVQRLEEKALRD
uniref:CCHC-type domain-containing protein n=1 Tax=Tanacetum cinerariifolium TaxID=118510 RepID=A0A699GLA9_TANCI|nr:hypothetical protein [Tanacetum cinerariifolium]